MGEGRCVRGVVFYVLEVAVVVCGEVGIYEGVGEVASVDAWGVVVVVALYGVSFEVLQGVIKCLCKV